MTTPPKLLGSLIGKVVDAAVDVNCPEDLAPGLERVLGLELDADELEYVTALGQAVLRAVLDARPQ
jgi:hypothetical protein